MSGGHTGRWWGGVLGPGRAVEAGFEEGADTKGRRGRAGPHVSRVISVCKGSEAGGSGSFQEFLLSKEGRMGTSVGGFVCL